MAVGRLTDVEEERRKGNRPVDNLTFTSRIVSQEQAGIQPQPGDCLVPMRQVKEGRIFNIENVLNYLEEHHRR